MLNVLRGALTRRMFFLFLGLALLPTLILLIVPTIFQIRAEQEAIVELEKELRTKAADIFSRLVVNKAMHYEQVLQPRIDATQQLANQITASLNENGLSQPPIQFMAATFDLNNSSSVGFCGWGKVRQN